MGLLSANCTLCVGEEEPIRHVHIIYIYIDSPGRVTYKMSLKQKTQWFQEMLENLCDTFVDSIR